MFRKVLFFITKDGFRRGQILKDKNILHYCGENVFFQPRVIPSDPKLVSLGDNVVIASKVVFINHDVIHHMFNNLEDGSTSFFMGKIEIGNNVFIGSNTVLFPNIEVASNVIIAAGSHVYKDISESGVYAGNPLKKVKEFDELFIDRKTKHLFLKDIDRNEIIRNIWKDRDYIKKIS